jgi:hypothetical protein
MTHQPCARASASFVFVFGIAFLLPLLLLHAAGSVMTMRLY